MRSIVALVIGLLLLAFMAWEGKEGFLSAKKYEASMQSISEVMTPSNLAKLQINDIASKLTFGFIKNELQEKIKRIQKESKELKAKSILIAKKYALLATILLIVSLFGYFQVTTILLSIGALISLINGLITPILMITVHKNIEYLGDVVLSFESKGIIGSIEKLYSTGNYPVAIVIALFSVLIPAIKTLSLLILSIFEKQKFAKKMVLFFKHLGKWSMADVFVVSLLLVFLSSSSTDVSKAEIEIGLYFFLTYVIFSILASITAEQMLKKSSS